MELLQARIFRQALSLVSTAIAKASLSDAPLSAETFVIVTPLPCIRPPTLLGRDGIQIRNIRSDKKRNRAWKDASRNILLRGGDIDVLEIQSAFAQALRVPPLKQPG